MIFLITSCANGKERNYTGSTPANAVVKAFLGIPLSDSIDFIRWNLTLKDNQYTLHCNYGISKPNTNGFINGGQNMELTGTLRKEKNYYELQSGKKSIKLAELNTDLLHFADSDNSLLVGNGGWSYVLNNLVPEKSDQSNISSKGVVLKDSMAFQGRTPCGVPGIIAEGKLCYKLKWLVTFYANPKRNAPTTYNLLGTGWRKEGGLKGNWKIVTGKDGRIIYELNDDKGKAFIHLLKLDDNVLIFTDANGKLLTGDLDFSYTLNRL